MDIVMIALWVGLVAAMFPIGGAIYRLSRGTSGVVTRWREVKPQEPGTAVRKSRLSWADVGAGLQHLVPSVSAFDPECIFGICRGGAIVGGAMAKLTGKPEAWMLDVSPDRESAVIEHRARVTPVPERPRILLVDDAWRTGRNMTQADDYLRKTYPMAEIKRLVLVRIDNHDATARPRHVVKPDWYAFTSVNARVLLPWDR